MGQKSLWNPEGKVALDYLKDKRNLSEDIIKQFKVGYCPREESYFLAGRIIMPVFDVYGNLIALSTRDFEAPKEYQHWHEPFDKSNYLYGFDIAKKYIQWNKQVIVVEGQFDVMALHTYLLPMTVGIFGTAFSIMHVSRLARYCKDFYLVFDDDKAGDECRNRSKKMYKDYNLGSYGINFYYPILPQKLDPDEYVVKYGKDAFINEITKEVNSV